MLSSSGANALLGNMAARQAASGDGSPASVVVEVAVATAVAVAAAAAESSDSDPTKDEPQGECSLMGPFALIVQAALGALALLSLVYKRWRERPQRPLKIWFFDVSKQVFGSVLVHIANIFMSLLTSGRFSVKVEPGAAATAAVSRLLARDDEPYVPNPCSFYLLNLAIDVSYSILLPSPLRLTANHPNFHRPPSESRSSSSSSASRPASSPSRPWASPSTPSSPATTATRPTPGGGSSSPSSTSSASSA